MMKLSMIVFVLVCLVGSGLTRWTQSSDAHLYSPSTSAQISDGIKQKLLTNLNLFTDQNFAQQLQSDLNQGDDSKRQLTQISSSSANQLFTILGLDDPGCDQNGDAVINGNQLKCLNYAWKAYLPQ